VKELDRFSPFLYRFQIVKYGNLLCNIIAYLPPPAQAQAQPAQAQAQAQAHPPPPLRLLQDFPLLVDTGAGFVLSVILLVKSLTLPITLAEKFCTLFTTEAAKVAPGKVGNDRPPLPPVVEGTGEAMVFGAPPTEGRL
jgi:hypothetical protein